MHPKNSRGETCIPFALIQKLAARLSSEALTNRELEVPELLPRRSSQKMGATLFIGETTVKSHLRNTFGELLSPAEGIAAANRGPNAPSIGGGADESRRECRGRAQLPGSRY